MRSAILLLGILVNMGLQTIAKSNGVVIYPGDCKEFVTFLVIVFVVFFVADFYEFGVKVFS